MINAAVSVDKKYKYDPIGRAENSIKLLWPVVYSRPEKAIEMGNNLREMHRKIKGTTEDGQKYYALDPEVYTWVFMTGYDASIRAFDFFATPLSAQERTAMFDEWKKMGRQLGVPETQIPDTEDEYWKYFNYIIDNRMEIGAVLKDVIDPKLYDGFLQSEDMRKVPNLIWKIGTRAASKLQHSVVVATLPARAKKKLQLKQSLVDKVIFRILQTTFRFGYPKLPERMKYIPLAWEAIEDARMHPEAYRWG